MLEAELLKTIFRDATDLVVILRSDRCIKTANPAFNKTVPGAREGVDFMDLVVPAARSRVLTELVRAAGGEEVLVEIPHGTASEQAAVIEYRFFPIDGGMVAAMGRPRVPEVSAKEALGQARAELQMKSRMLDEIQLELTQVPFIDPATGVWNRMQVIERLAGEWSRCERYGSPLTCLLIDVENLEALRAGNSGVAVDEALKAVARRLKAVVRDHDIVGRYGGDCFVIVAVQSDSDGARSLIGRIQEMVASEPVSIDQGLVPLTIRIGGATNKSEGVEILEDLFSVAESALEDARSENVDAKVASEMAV